MVLYSPTRQMHVIYITRITVELGIFGSFFGEVVVGQLHEVHEVVEDPLVFSCLVAVLQCLYI